MQTDSAASAVWIGVTVWWLKVGYCKNISMLINGTHSSYIWPMCTSNGARSFDACMQQLDAARMPAARVTHGRANPSVPALASLARVEHC